MDWVSAIPVTAVIISIGTLLFTALSLNQKAASDAVVLMQARLLRVEADLEQCKKDRDDLRIRVMELKQDVVLSTKRSDDILSTMKKNGVT